MIRKVATTALRSSVVSKLSGQLVNPSLRTLCFHTVDDQRAFDRQMAWLARNFNPVTPGQIVKSLNEDIPLPNQAVWVTFDDGSPTVVDRGLPILGRYDIPATMFICPGLIESGASFWWDIALAASGSQLLQAAGCDIGDGQAAVQKLKQMSDGERRRILAQLPDPGANTRRQLSVQDIHRWAEAGHTLGNHTWDHPCLDTASEQEQLFQVESAHAWLVHNVEPWTAVFAYPNGNWSQVIEPKLTELDYQLAVLHDHRMTRDDPALRMSRLHTDANDDLARFRSVVSGTQPTLRSLASRLRTINV
ncbi:MAG: peptidoglycan/xylan/chitin deacetylase (PgdA/CDA1 family) [Acidimicrobiales bacterium]|jgi:peptidoglycan/xylan/chitin deacetylase (PgdA/CDA1 family)